MGNQSSCPCVKSSIDDNTSKNVDFSVEAIISSPQEKTIEKVMDFPEDDDEDESDDVFELPQFAPGQYTNKRDSVSAGHIDLSSFNPPSYPKTISERQYLLQILKESFLFSSLDEPVLEKVLDALEKELVEYTDELIIQGEEGDCLYIVDSGIFTCYKVLSNDERKELTKCHRGDTFGELALLYNAPRAATVQCTSLEGGVVWRLDRISFSALVIGAARLKRDLYASFLDRVRTFDSLDVYEKSQLVDALKHHIWEANQVIIREGEEGDRFYILKSGKLIAMKGGKMVETYVKPGDFFGELALVKTQPRAATVTALELSEGLSIEKKAFHRLLGPAADILKQKEEGYSITGGHQNSSNRNNSDIGVMTSLESEMRKGTVLEGINTGLL